MATTQLIKHHISKGLTIAQSMKDRFDYGKNPDKTRDGALISAYMCDPETADAEFLLSKAQYKAITGREQKRDEDVLCYQIRQSFLPGETDPEAALRIGHDFAMRWTKGNHAFFVVSHIDRPHPHIHIYYNSTSLDCTRKFRDFFGSAWAMRRLSDRICYENNLSVIREPKLRSQGQFRHYGEWLGQNKPPTFQERLKAAIDAVLRDKPEDMDTFLSALAALGFAHKCGRGGTLSFRTDGQERFTRLRASTLGEGYGQDEILAMIEGCIAFPDNRGVAASTTGRQPIGTTRKINLVIDLQQRLKAGKGPAYEQWVKVYNLKMMGAALQYLQENNLLVYEDLAAKTDGAVDRFHELAVQIQEVETVGKRNRELMSAVVDYARTRPVFEEYRAKQYGKKYLAEHEDDIQVHRAAQKAMREILDGSKLPKMDALKAEAGRLAAEKKSLYAQYRAAQKDMREAVAVKGNIDHLLGLTDAEKNKERTR